MIITVLLFGCADDDNFLKVIKEENGQTEPFTIDEAAPEPVNSGIIKITDIEQTSLVLVWPRAEDNTTPESLLEYKVFQSTSSLVDTVENVFDEGYGEPLCDWSTETYTIDVTGLDQDTVYYFNIFVRDEAGEISSYNMISVLTGGVTSGDVIFMYSTPQCEGDIGGRDGADKMCVAYASDYALSCTIIKSFISINESDEIRDMPVNYGVPLNFTIKGPTGIQLASDWEDLFDEEIDATLENAEVVNGDWWSGSDSNGAYDSSVENCSEWTDANGKGGAGNDNRTDELWIESNSRNCNSSLSILCLCW